MKANKMQIFAQEIKDGLGEKLTNSNSLAFEIFPSIENVAVADKVPDLEEVSNNVDLVYFNSILASVGWNKNDDVFDAKELWKARSTPVNKKINYMHDEKDIIGHMINSNIIDFNGKLIVGDEDSIPDGFDVVVGGFIYKHWQDAKLRERMGDILEKVSKQEIAVSMECLFPTFDYAVITPDGQNRIIRRDDDTAFLTKHLRMYGGSGSYEGFKVGRLLRSMIFTGNALVDRPANPRSLILKKDALSFSGSIASLNIFKTNAEIKVMTDTVSKAEYDALVKKLESAEAVAKDISKKEIDSLKEAHEKAIAENKTLQSELAVSKELAKSHEDSSSKLNDTVKKLEEELAEAKAKLDAYHKEMCKSKRKAAMASIDVDETRANELIEKFSSVSDEIFDEFVKAMPKRTTETKETNTTTASLKEALEKAEDKETTVVVNSDTQNSLIAKASEWFASTLSKKSE